MSGSSVPAQPTDDDTRHGSTSSDMLLASSIATAKLAAPPDSALPQTTQNSRSAQGSTKSWEGEDESKLSKNQLRKKRKWEKMEQKKREKKLRDKQVKAEKAKAEGRDLDAERRQVEKNRLDGSGRAKRNQKWLERFRREASGYQICIDCSFDHLMTPKEINSLGLQIHFCYAANKKSRHPATVTVTSLGGETRKFLDNVEGFPNWSDRAFLNTSESLEKAYSDPSKIVYLTSDSEHVLESIDDDKIYCIGGIVDRNRLKRVAIDRAEGLGIATAKLPIADFLHLVTTKVLTTNHVFDILLKFKELQDWKAALLAVLPKRKNVEEKQS